MEKKLYRVEVCLYVMAEDEYDACWAATNARFDVFECDADEAESIDPGWEEAVPYNSEDDRTCSELLISKMHVTPPGAKNINVSHLWAMKAEASNAEMPLEQ